MKKEDLSAREIAYWQDRMDKLAAKRFNKKEWCDLGHELMEKHDLTEKDAVSILHSKPLWR